VLLAIVTADCTPVLLADREAGVIGAGARRMERRDRRRHREHGRAMLALGARREAIAAADRADDCAGELRRSTSLFRARFVDAIRPTHASLPPASRATGSSTCPAMSRAARSAVSPRRDLGLDTYARPTFYSSAARRIAASPPMRRQMSLIGLSLNTLEALRNRQKGGWQVNFRVYQRASRGPARV
jgi:hypothetical protein